MHKMDLVDAVQKKLGTATKKDVEEGVDAVFDAIMEAMGRGEEVSVSGFGTFIVKRRGARMGINPRTKEKIQIAETVTPKFRAGKVLKETVKH